MREILFRGKRIDNGEWVEGWHQPETTITHWDGSEEKFGVAITYKTEDGFFEDVYVIPETIGQYTGLTDKNGKRIFEGDIVRAKRINTDKSYLGDVIWWLGCFAIQETETRNVPAIDLFYEYEVIGNIHDNPELLKGENK